MLPVCASLPHQEDPVGSSGMSDVLPVRGFREGGSVVGLLHQPDPTVERLVANKGRAASPVKAVSRRRRGPKAGAEGQPLQGLLVGHTRTAEFDGWLTSIARPAGSGHRFGPVGTAAGVISLAVVAPKTILCATSRRHPFMRRCSVRNWPAV